MNFFTRLNTKIALSRKYEEKLFQAVSSELELGQVNRGLWLKALSNCHGNESQAKATYVKLRVQAIKDDMLIQGALEQDIPLPEESEEEEIQLREYRETIEPSIRAPWNEELESSKIIEYAAKARKDRLKRAFQK